MLKEEAKILKDKETVIILAYAPAGLGHLRVTDALYHGLPKTANPLLLGSQDKSITRIHRILSIHPIFRFFFELGQSGIPQYIVTYIYRNYLWLSTKLIYQQLTTILDQRIEETKTVLIIATHFGLAHQIAAIKDKLAKERKVKIVLAVQVTDDSPQYMWYIPGADLTFVPSEYTRRELAKYAAQTKLAPTHFVINPYPISPFLAEELSDIRLHERKRQLDRNENNIINVSMPVSGAAVGTGFFTKVIDQLYEFCPRFRFQIIAKNAIYTLPFLNEIMNRPYIKLNLATTDKGVVEKYDEVYKRNTISLEITKPSEQAFKGLINPTKVGGAIMLFAQPVGRQEYENLDFLVRHKLLPNLTEHKFLWNHAQKNLDLADSKEGQALLEQSFSWRGLLLPHHSEKTARFIWWACGQGLYKNMLQSRVMSGKSENELSEISSEGVDMFWEKVALYVENMGKYY